ncbi:MAG: T9SS type A sorting domain-containing protein [Bacteroidales bacterium]|nr:T9SS type A sorting domain-containing protein [Bacteroidales bacterium]
MKTTFFATVKWLTVTIGFLSIIYFVFNGPIIRFDNLLEREKFESFLHEQITKFFQNDSIDRNDVVKADMPGVAALHDYLKTVDPELKRVPKDKLKDALEYTQELQQLSYLKSTSLLEWSEAPSDMGGRTRALALDPNDPDGKKAWAGGVTGGLWYTDDITDIEEPWVPVNDFFPNLAISCITFDPNDPETIYVGTGEAQTAIIIYRESSGTGFGILKSADGGENWEVLDSTTNFSYITDIAIRDEGGSSVVYAGVVSGVYMGAQHQSQPSDGLYRSENGGLSWQQVLPDITELDVPYAPSDIEFGADGRIFVGSMQNIDGEGGATILYSDEGTPGSWSINEEYKILIENTPDFDLPGRVIIAAAPSDANRIYAFITQGYFYGLPGYECHILLKSEDKGESWDFISLPPNTSWDGNWAYIAWHALAASVDPNDPSTIIVGGLDLFRSTDSGTSWIKISDWTGMNNPGIDYVHGDHHTIVFRDNSSNDIIFSTDGGVFYTDNGTEVQPVFIERSKSFNTLQSYSCAISPIPGETYYITGCQDNGTELYDGNPIIIQNMLSGGDGCYCFWDKNEPELFITSSQNNWYYIFINGNQVNQVAGFQSGDFVCAADYDYNLNIIYANAAGFFSYPNRLLRLSDIGDTPFGEYLYLATNLNVPFSHVKYSPFSPSGKSTLFLGSKSGKVFRVENIESIPDVEEIGTQVFPPANVSCIAIGGSEDTLLVTFSNYGVSSVWQTYDGGESWIEKEGNLPDMPVRWALYHPQSAKAAMLATEIGVWTTTNLDDDQVLWEPDNTGFANVRVDMLKLRDADNTVLAGTHGRGLFTTTYNYNPSTDIVENTFEELRIYPNPTSGKLYLNLEEYSDEQVLIEIYDSGNRLVKTFSIRQNNSISSKSIDITELKTGLYLIKANIGDKIFTNKILKSK